MTFSSAINGLQVHHSAAKPNTWRGYVYRFDAQAFSAASTYAVGDEVVYNGVHYKCTTAVTTAGAFNQANWARATNGVEYTYHLIFVEDPEFDQAGSSGSVGDDGHPAYRIKVTVDVDGGKTYSDPVSLDAVTGGTYDGYTDATTPHTFEIDSKLFKGFVANDWESGTKEDYDELATGGNRW